MKQPWHFSSMVAVATAMAAIDLSTGAAIADAAPPTGEAVVSDFASLVKALKGRWQTQVYHEDSQRSVAFQEAADHGEQVWRMGPGGLTLIEEEHSITRR